METNKKTVNYSAQTLSGFQSKTIMFSLFVILLMLPLHINGLYCYRCISMECPGNQNECESVRKFLLGHIRPYYHMDTFLPNCPDANDSFSWRLLHIDEKPCPEEGNAATCTAGRMQIKSFKKIKVVGEPVLISHATILGCGNRNLLNALRAAMLENRCDLLKTNGTDNGNGLVHKLELEHCSRIETVCHTEDFCVSHEQSIVKEFKDHNKLHKRFEYGLIIGIGAFIIVVFAAIIGASLCSYPLNRPSNLPKTASSIEDPDLVSVRPRSSQKEDKLLRNNRNDESIGLYD